MKRSQLPCIILLVVVLVINLAISAVNAADGPPALVVASAESVPFFFATDEGRHQGLLIDFWRLWSQKTGRSVTFRSIEKGQEVNAMQSGRADILAGVSFASDLSQVLYFSRPFYEVTCHLYHLSSKPPVKGFNDLQRQRVGVVKAGFLDQYVRQHYKQTVVKPYLTAESLIKGALAGEVDAFALEGPVAESLLTKSNARHKIRKVPAHITTRHLHAGVRKTDRTLLLEINRGMASIQQEELNAVVRNWIDTIKTSGLVIATSKGSAPFHFQDVDGQPAGMFVDLWRLWALKTGREVHFQTAGWNETLQLVRDGRADIHAGLFYNQKRDEFLDYATPLHKSDTHFFFHKSISGLRTLEDLKGFRLGIINGDFAVDYIRSRLPEATLALYDNNQALFDAVESGAIRVFIKDTPIALHHLRRRQILNNFRYHRRFPLYSNMFYAAVREGQQELLGDIRRGMDSITAEERAEIVRKWMGTADRKTPDVLTIALSDGYMPLSLTNFEGKPAGMLVDVWKLWSKKTGQEIEFRISSWPETLNALRSGEADIHAGLLRSKSRGKWLDFSQPFYEVPSTVFYHTRLGEVVVLENLYGRRLGAVNGSYQAQYLKENFPDVSVVPVHDAEEMVQATLDGSTVAFIGETPICVTQMARMGESGSFRRLADINFRKTMHAAIAKGRPELLQLVDQGLNAISNQELATIERQWIFASDERQLVEDKLGIRLTAAEEAWLKNHHTIRLGVNQQWPPFDYVDKNGKHSGIASDYVRLLNHRLGISMKMMPGLSWDQVMQGFRDRTVDVVPCLTMTPQRETFLNFTAPYNSFPWVIITRNDHSLVGGITDLYGKKVAVVNAYAIYQHLVSDHPAVMLHVTDSPAAGLKAVSRGKADAYVGSLGVASYIMAQYQLANLKVAAPAEFGEGNDQLRFGVRKDWPELATILNKGLASISQKHRNQIRQNWLAVRFEYGIDMARIRSIGLQVGVIFIVIVGLILFWNRRLKKEIDERERTEQKLMQSEERLELALEGGQLGSWDTDFMTGRTIVNSRWLRMLGYTADEFASSHTAWLNSIYPDDRNRVLQFGRDYREGRVARYEIEYRAITRQGRIKWLISKGASVSRDKKGRPFRMVGTVMDITERKQMENELVQARDRAETADRLKSAFLAAMSHELRTPLNSIIGFTGILRQGLVGPLSEEQQKQLGMVENSAHHLLALINDVLDLSKIEAGQLEIDMKRFDLGERVEKVIQLFRPLAQEKELFLRSDVSPGINHIVSDPRRFEQILINLLNNALKFTEKGGVRVIVEPSDSLPGTGGATDESTASPSGCIIVQVVDTGIGISPANIHKLFQAFQQLDTGLSRRYEGTGLGLSICKKLVTMQGGDIWAESDGAGKGTRFIFTLPV